MEKGYVQKLLNEQADELSSKAPKGNKYHFAAQYFSNQITGEEYAGELHPTLALLIGANWQTEFLTTLLYNEITSVGAAAKL